MFFQNKMASSVQMGFACVANGATGIAAASYIHLRLQLSCSLTLQRQVLHLFIAYKTSVIHLSPVAASTDTGVRRLFRSHLYSKKARRLMHCVSLFPQLWPITVYSKLWALDWNHGSDLQLICAAFPVLEWTFKHQDVHLKIRNVPIKAFTWKYEMCRLRRSLENTKCAEEHNVIAGVLVLGRGCGTLEW